MQRVRILSRAESLLRDPATSSANLAAAPGVWHELRPRFSGERFDVTMLGITLAGPALLQNLDAFGTAAGSLEVAVEVDDGYGARRDQIGLVPQTISSGREWSMGVHQGTIADSEAGGQRDGSVRAGLRGAPVSLNAAPNPAKWTSPVLDLRYGNQIEATSWDCWRLAGPDGQTVAAPTIELQTGRRVGANIQWNVAQTVASTSVEIDRGYTDLAAPLAGDVYRWGVSLPYMDPGVATDVGDTVVRTATFFSLCVWVRLAASRWAFSNISQLVERSELSRYLGIGGWNGGQEDIVLLRVPLSIQLHARLNELIRARFSGGACSLLEVCPAVDLRFEDQ